MAFLSVRHLAAAGWFVSWSTFSSVTLSHLQVYTFSQQTFNRIKQTNQIEKKRKKKQASAVSICVWMYQERHVRMDIRKDKPFTTWKDTSIDEKRLCGARNWEKECKQGRIQCILYRFGLNTTREPHEIYGTKFFFYIVETALVYGGAYCSLCTPQPRYQSDSSNSISVMSYRSLNT